MSSSMKNSTYRRRNDTVSTQKKSQATIPAAWARPKLVHDSQERPGAGSMPAFLKDCPHGRRGDGDAQPGELAVDAAIPPSWILVGETDDRLAGPSGSAGPSGLAVGVGPVLRDEPSVPAQQRIGLHDQDRPPVSSQDASERGEEHAVDRFELGSGHLTAQHAQLMPKERGSQHLWSGPVDHAVRGGPTRRGQDGKEDESRR